MKDKTRLITSIVFVLSMIMTLISAYVIKIQALVVLFFLIQIAAFIWYSLSYIPFARKIFKKCCKEAFSDEP